MRVIGFEFTKISASRKEEPLRELNINYNIEVLSIEKDKVDLFKEEDILKFKFRYTTTYQPEFAKIEFEGVILAIFDKGQIKDVLDKWKDKAVSESIRLSLFNLIMSRCNIKALELGENLSLPPHIPLPRVSPQDKEEKSEKSKK